MKNNINIREAHTEDARFFWELVNEPVVRSVSFSSDEIPWETHKNWFEKKLNENESFMFVATDDRNEKIGQLRFEKKEEGYVISVSLLPQFRGKGLGSELIKLGSEKLFQVSPDSNLINAYIKRDNISSIKSFEKAGYTKKGFSTINEKDDAVLMIKSK